MKSELHPHPEIPAQTLARTTDKHPVLSAATPKERTPRLSWLHQIPQRLKLALQSLQFRQAQSAPNYEPLHLYLSPADLNPQLGTATTTPKRYATNPVNTFSKRLAQTQRMDLDSFRFMLDQLPELVSIEFFGHQHDPLETPELFEMMKYAARLNGTVTTLKTHGLLLPNRWHELLASPLDTVVINLIGHKPSIYSLISGRPLNEFMPLLNNIQALVQQRNAVHSPLKIVLRMIVDVHHVKYIPEMIQFAESLGVEGLQLDNFVKMTPTGPIKTDRTLYRDHPGFVEFLQQIQDTQVSSSRLQITLPVLLNRDMATHRYCEEAFTTISVDAQFNVSACSQQYLSADPIHKIWHSQAFNSVMYQNLRTHFSTPKSTVPLACQNCAKNMPCS